MFYLEDWYNLVSIFFKQIYQNGLTFLNTKIIVKYPQIPSKCKCSTRFAGGHAASLQQ